MIISAAGVNAVAANTADNAVVTITSIDRIIATSAVINICTFDVDGIATSKGSVDIIDRSVVANYDVIAYRCADLVTTNTAQDGIVTRGHINQVGIADLDVRCLNAT